MSRRAIRRSVDEDDPACAKSGAQSSARADENNIANVASTDTVQKSKHKATIEKVPIKLIIDKSNEPIGVTHYLAMALWLGWPFFYLLLMWTFPLLYWYARPLLIAIVVMLVASALYPIDSRKQPKWAMEIGAAIMR